MPTKRQIFELLPRQELLAVADRFSVQVAVADRRVKNELVDALTSSRKVAMEAVLDGLTRDQLKHVCREFGLDDSGREKAVLVARLLGQEATPSTRAAAVRTNGRNNGNGCGNRNGQPAVLVDGRLTQERLGAHLWSAADILRGSIDSSDYKNYIFGLLFLKRLSDVFEEEAERLIADGQPAAVAWDDPDEHQFFVPKRARWGEIQKIATNVGETLNKACAALEERNPSLEGVLAGIDFNDERKLGDTKNRDSVLSRLVQHFSTLRLHNSTLSEPDMLGRAYEYLIERFADDAGKKGGEFYTPRGVVQLIVDCLAPKEGMRICDPTCGSGGMLIECARYVERHRGNARNLTLHGQEKNLGTWAICKMNMLLHGLPDARIEKGDTIRDPKLVQDGELILYDRVIANPPFSLDEWGIEVAETDGFSRFRFGLPPKTKGDLAFVQHMVATLSVHGQLGVVMPHGVLFRGGSEGKIREGLLREDLVEAVIGLAPNLFYGTGIPAAILVLNRGKPKERKGKVLFVHAAEEMVNGPTQNKLGPENVARIASTFRQFSDEQRFSRVVGNAELAQNEFNLNITRYVDVGTEHERPDVQASLKRLAELTRQRDEAEAKMRRLLEGIGYGPF